MNDLVGRHIKGYILQQIIGAGGFGVVYRASQPIVNREVAIKVILPIYANNPDFVRRFEREAQLVAHLEHPFIVPLYDYWREPDGAYLVMRYISHGNLGLALARGGAWSLPKAAKLVEQIAAALNAAHQKGIVHQDLKPANILLDEFGNAYLTDFGIAKDILDNTESRNADGKREVFGSPDYMSPEQASFKDVTPQSDLYSLGLIFYALLSGQSAFQSNSVTTLLQKQIYERVPLITLERPDLPLEINTIIRRATDKEPEARYNDVLSFAADIQSVIGTQPLIESDEIFTFGRSGGGNYKTGPISATLPLMQLATSVVVARPEPINPYKGLRAFEEADDRDFFGRGELIRQLVQHLDTQDFRKRFLAVIGPSGSGKSSVVKAGLLPALRRGEVINSERWFITAMVPGSDPFMELEQALLRVAFGAPEKPYQEQLRADENALSRIVREIVPDQSTDLLLLIDQFEEIFTRIEREDERSRLLANLVQAVKAENIPFRLIITLRADFYDRPLLYPELGELIRQCTQVVLPLSPTELEQAITSPAYNAGLNMDRDLVTEIISDVSEQPGMLPLLQFTLTELYDHRVDNTLTRDAYQRIGGVSSSLARRADELYTEFNEQQRLLTRQLFLRLVTPGEGTEDTRRRVMRDELVSLNADPKAIEEILDIFGKYRLLTFDRNPATRTPTVEIAHEALISRWKLLREWLDASREDLRLQRRLAEATDEWLRGGRDSSFLASGARLTQFEALTSNTAIALNAQERDYVVASISLRQRAANRLKLFIAGLIAATLAALGLAIFAFDQQNQAVEAEATTAAERDRANEQAEISRANALAMSALTQRERLDSNLLTSIAALEVHDTLEARRSLLINLLANPRLVTFLQGHTGAVRGVTISPDQSLLATGSDDHTVRVWDAATFQPVGAPFEGHTDIVWDVAFSPDGKRLASASRDQKIMIWDIEHPEQVPLTLEGHTDEAWALAFSPDGNWLVSGGVDDAVILWDLTADPPTAKKLAGHQGDVFSVAFSPDGKTFASGGADNTILLWTISGDEPTPLVGHSNWILTLDFSPDGSVLASSGIEREVFLWNVADAQPFGKFPTTHTRDIRKVIFSPDGQNIATASEDNTVQLWSLTTLQPLIPALTGHTDAVWDVVFSRNGQHLLSASLDQSAIWWAVQPPQPLAKLLRDHTESVWSLDFSSDSCWLASGGGESGAGEDFAVRLWQIGCQQEAGPITPILLYGHAAQITSVDFSPDGHLLASGSADKTILIWSAAIQELAAPPLEAHQSSVTSVAFSPNGNLLASADAGGMILLWQQNQDDIWQPTEQTLAGHPGQYISGLAFSPDGKILASASWDGTVILWDTAAFQAIGEPLQGHSERVEALAFSPDGKMLASGSRDLKVLLWNVDTGEPIGQPLAFHTNWVTALAFSPDGKMLASGSRDNTIMLWDVASQQPIEPALAGHRGWINSLKFSPDGQYLASGSGDAGIFLWDVTLTAWKSLACERANRVFTANEWVSIFGQDSYRDLCSEED